MHLIRVLAAAAAMVTAVAIGPAAMASGTPDQPATAQLVRGGGGGFRGGGGFHGGGGGHGFGFAGRGGYAWHGGRGYHMRYGYLGGGYPYGYGCPYPSWRFGSDVCSPFSG